MSRFVSAVVLICCCLLGSLVFAEDYVYEGQQKIKNEIFDKLNSSVKVNGQCDIRGTYDHQDGRLEISIDGQSRLEVSGAANKVVIKRQNGQSSVSLRGMKIGAGGVEITDLDGQSELYVGECSGDVDIKRMDGQAEMHYREGTRLTGQANVKGQSKLISEK